MFSKKYVFFALKRSRVISHCVFCRNSLFTALLYSSSKLYTKVNKPMIYLLIANEEDLQEHKRGIARKKGKGKTLESLALSVIPVEKHWHPKTPVAWQVQVKTPTNQLPFWQFSNTQELKKTKITTIVFEDCFKIVRTLSVLWKLQIMLYLYTYIYIYINIYIEREREKERDQIQVDWTNPLVMKKTSSNMILQKFMVVNLRCLNRDI